MTPEEETAFLADQRTMTVATLGPSGQPHMVAMWYVLIDGLIKFWTFTKSQKAVNLRRDPRITCLVHSGDTYHQLRGVEIAGTAIVLDAMDDVLAVGRAIALHYGHRIPLSDPAAVAAQATHRIAVVVQPSSIVSWDHSKLGADD